MNRSALVTLAAGAVVLCVGVWLILPAAAFIFAGLLVMALGVLQLDIGGGE